MPVKLFVGNLVPSVTTNDLIHLFSKYGKVVEGDALGKFGFVHMETMDEANAAISGLNGTELNGSTLKVEVSAGKKGGGGGGGGSSGSSGSGILGIGVIGGRISRNIVTVNTTGGGGDTKLFVGNLTPEVTSDDLRELFSQYGEVTECDAKGKFGFVHMSSHADAMAAMKQLIGHPIRNTTLNVEISGSKGKGGGSGGGGGSAVGGGGSGGAVYRDDFRDGGRGAGGRGSGAGGTVKLFVGNLTESITSSDLRELFQRYGSVTECDAKGRYGFVHMSTYNEAQKAIDNLMGYNIKGQSLNVEISSSKGRDRDGGGGGGGGGRFDRGASFNRDFGDRNSRAPAAGGAGGFRGGRDDGSAKIFVGNLSEQTRNDDLRSLFSRYGRVKEADALGKFGFVHMYQMTDAQRAIAELHGTTLNGIRINVELSQKSGGGAGGPERSRGGNSGGRGGRDGGGRGPYDRPRGEPARDAMAVADYYQRTGRLPPDDAALDRARPDPYSAYTTSALYERERLAYDAYARDAYARDVYARAAVDPYARPADPYARPAADPYARAPPDAYSAARRYDEYERLARDPAVAAAAAAAAARDYPPSAASAALPAAVQVNADRFSLTPEAAYAISRYAEVDRYRAGAIASYAPESAARGATNGSVDPYAVAVATSYTPASYSTGASYSSAIYGGYPR